MNVSDDQPIIRRIRPMIINPKTESEVTPATGPGHFAGMVQGETMDRLTKIYSDVKNPLWPSKICPSCGIEMALGEGRVFKPAWNPIFEDLIGLLELDSNIRCHEECYHKVVQMPTEKLAKSQGGLVAEAWKKLRG